MDLYQQRFSVSYDYPVWFGRGLLGPGQDMLIEAMCADGEDHEHMAQVFVDSGVAEAWPDLSARFAACFARHGKAVKLVCEPEIVPGGERAKNSREAAERVMESIAARHLCRQSYVIAVGGGSALDIIGLAASLVHRGVRVIRIPTTVLSQADSGVGVKTGIDAYGVKNFAGTFAPPFAVFIDFDFLDTLDLRYWTGGVAEAYKVALIKDSAFFEYLKSNAAGIRNRDSQVIEQVVRRAAHLHLEHIRTGGDPFEFGTARPLDFGHWSAHRLEVLSDYEIGHGQAVAIGMALDCCYAERTGRLTPDERDDILAAMRDTGLPIWSDLLERRAHDGLPDILRGLDEFREHLGGRLTITLPDGIGKRVEIHDVDAGLVGECLAGLKQFAERGE